MAKFAGVAGTNGLAPSNGLLACRSWSVDRWGRLLVGVVVVAGVVLGLLHHPAWLIMLLLLAGNLIVTSFTDRCVVHDTLIRLGAREREDLFLPGGSPRPEWVAHQGGPQAQAQPIASTDRCYS